VRDPRFSRARAWEQHNRPTPVQVEEARTRGHAIADGPVDVERLKEAGEALERQRPGIWEAFHGEFVRAVRQTPERRALWVHALEDAFDAARGALSTSLLSELDGSAFEGASLNWKETKDPFSVWGGRDTDVAYSREDLWLWGQVLLQVAPEAGLRALDALPYPSLMDEILVLYFREDREAIEAFIEAAPIAFDEHGRWVSSRSVAALLVTDLVTEHARSLQNAVRYPIRSYGANDEERAKADVELKELEQSELPTWMRRAFGLLLERPDGKRIALAYLANVSHGKLIGRGLQPHNNDLWTADAAALEALAMMLKGASVGVGEVREAWRSAATIACEDEEDTAKRIRVGRRVADPKVDERDGEGARTLYGQGLPFLHGAAVLLGDSADADSIAALWGWFADLLVGRDPGLTLINHGTSLTEVPQRIGVLLSRLPDPDVRFKSAYAKLEPVRRQGLFAHRSEGLYDDLESIVLLRVGLNTAANWFDRVKVGEQAEAARALFFWIYERARRLWLTAALDTGDAKQSLVSSCFAFMPYLFGDALGDALRRAIPPIASDPRLLVTACANLHINHAEPRRIEAFVADAGADLPDALRTVRQWAELTGLKQNWPEHLRTLAEELGIDQADPVNTPESGRPRSACEVFEDAVPWGTALVQRLAEDGCTSVRWTPLNEPRNTWLLQATAPESLRNRFGLSPDIRVLAVHGQVRGRDIRRGVEAIEGSADVDPDLLVVASEEADLSTKLRRLAGPWGQRIPWSVETGGFSPLANVLQQQLPTFDVFERRDPVRGRAFIGRRREVDAIATRLLRGQATGVFGLRKVGKSSLLGAVARAMDPASAVLATLDVLATTRPSTPPEALVVWLDVQSLVLRTQEALAERLWEALTQRLALAGLSTSIAPDPRQSAGVGIAARTADQASSADPLDKLRQTLGAVLDGTDVPLVTFVFDEYDLLFEGYGGEPAVAGVQQIFALLRSFAQSSGRVSLALVGRDPVFSSQALVNGFTNPLLGWLESFPLGPFSDEDATEVLRRLGKRVGLSVGDATVGLALRWTGGHPLLLREYGAALHELARAARGVSATPTDPLREQAITVFLRRDGVHTVCSEIEALLASRFPDALAVLRSPTILTETRGMTAGMAAKILFDFGLLRGTADAPWVPEVYADFFGSLAPASATLARGQHGT
jgi:hypothetical protein